MCNSNITEWMKINIRVLGSTSAGNCTLIWDENSALMIDCGFSPEYICRSLSRLKLDISFLSGVLITHTHTDHIKEPILKKFIRERIPVFCHEKVRPDLLGRYAIMETADNIGLLKTFTDEEFRALQCSFTISHTVVIMKIRSEGTMLNTHMYSSISIKYQLLLPDMPISPNQRLA